ncbi:MAG: PIG-L deacetylase family protein [Candidatus Helarchaeota archaeon]
MSRPKKILFFTPHPDDIEIGCPFAYLEALRLRYKVIEIIMTNGEFGTERDEFKGIRIARIRKMELRKANLVFEKETKNRIKVIRMGYVDGYLPINKKILNTIIQLIQAERPQIIFCPDPVFPQDFHPDHINTGKLIYYSLFKLKKSELPRVFYYYSVRTKFYLKCKWKDFKILQAALSEHKSQISPLGLKAIINLYKKVSIFRHLLERGSCSESYREQKFRDGKPITYKKFTFYERVLYYIFSSLTIGGYEKLHNLTPEDIGIDRHTIYT